MERRQFIATFTVALTSLPGMLRAQDAPRVIPHQSGQTEISGRPSRVVALEFSFVQTLDALGVLPAGIADDNQPARIELLMGRKVDYASVGTRLEPNLELVSALQPDLIIGDELRHSAIYDQLSSIAPTIILNSWEGDYPTIRGSVPVIAEALGIAGAGQKALEAHDAAMKAMAARIPEGEQRRILLAVATPDSMSLHSSSSFTGSVFRAIGLTPAIESDDAIQSGAGLERLIAVNPDILLVATDPGGTVLDQWQDNAAWKNISAVSAGNVFQVDRNQFSRFRGLKTAEMIATEVLAQVYGVK